MDIVGATALVTGGNGGIGAALVRAILSGGARHVYSTFRMQPPSADTQHTDRVTPLRMDVTDERSVARVAQLANDVRVVISAAGVLTAGGVLSEPGTAISAELQTNCVGLLNVARHFAPILEANGGGILVNILSISALASCPSLGIYSASKAAAWSLTQALRADLRSRGIKVVGALPGPVDTAMTRSMDVKKATADQVALAIIEGIKSGDDEIFPDAMSRQAAALWRKDPKLLEQQFALL